MKNYSMPTILFLVVCVVVCLVIIYTPQQTYDEYMESNTNEIMKENHYRSGVDLQTADYELTEDISDDLERAYRHGIEDALEHMYYNED